MFSRKDFLVSFSLANLCFFKQWNDLLDTKYLEPFYEALGAYPASYFGLVLSILITTALMLGLLTVSRRFFKNQARYLVLAPFFFFVVNGARLAINDYHLSLGFVIQKMGLPVTAGCLLLMGLLTLNMVYRHPRFLGRCLEVFCLLASPFLIITLSKGALTLNIRSGKAPQTVRADLQPNHKPKVVWLLFDGFDYRKSFPERPKGLKLPAIDALKDTSIFALNALQPGEDTSRSIPGYFVGKRLESNLVPTENNQLQLTYFGDFRPSTWDSENTLFSDLIKKDVHSAVAGWYIPYCDLFRKTVEICVRYPHYGINRQPYHENILPSSLSFFKELFSFSSSAEVRHIRNYYSLLKHAEEFATDDRINLAYIHFPVPHHPIIYDTKSKQTVPMVTKNLAEGYFQNLRLVDQALAAVRATLEKAGKWDDTLLLVTSDHSSRAIFLVDQQFENRVPFILKLPHQKEGRIIDTQFNAVLAKTLIEEHYKKPLQEDEVINLIRSYSTFTSVQSE